jgi:hypothetical protein
MTRSLATARTVGSWIAISLVATGLACASVGTIRKEPPPDRKYPLPPGVSADPVQFRAQIRGFARSGNVRQRARPGACTFCAVTVSIEALGNTHEVDHRNGPSPGQPVARLVNLDSTGVEGYYGLDPFIQAEYFLWVDRNLGSGRARWTLLRVPMGSGIVTAAPSRDMKLCHNREVGDIKSSDADFAEYKHNGVCTAIVVTGSLNASRSAMFPSEALNALIRRVMALLGSGAVAAQGGWIECSAGCCT